MGIGCGLVEDTDAGWTPKGRKRTGQRQFDGARARSKGRFERQGGPCMVESERREAQAG
jgi:hypothetical protein